MFLDDYSLDKSLGKGAFGEVFLTTKKGTDKLFATKKIERELIESGNTMKYLVNEIQILRELDHPNIVKFVEIKKTKNHYYIIMEYCNGGELCKALEKYMDKHDKPFTQEMVQHLMRQIINAFKYIHGKNIIHRDIKLENILLHYDSEEDRKNLNILKAKVKIIDFGFAAKMEKNGLKYTTLGSPINMDPAILKELAKRGKKTRKLGYDQKADIWSLGTICYEMLIGKCVFNAQDLDALVDQVEKGAYTVPTKLSKEVISFLNGMLQYEPNMRLNINQLSNHRFLTKNVKDFESIDMKKISKNIDKSKLTINVKANKTIWAIFNKEDEDKLLKISALDFDKPISEEKSLEKNNNKINQNNRTNTQTNNKQNINNNIQNNNQKNIQNNINQNNNRNNIQNNNHNQNNNLKNNPHINQNDKKHNIQNNNNQNNNRNNIQNNINQNINRNNTNNKNQNNNNQNNNRNINQNNINQNRNNVARNNVNNNNHQLNNNRQNNANPMIQKVNSANLPIVNYPIGIAPAQNYAGMPNYQAMQAVPMQGMAGMPVMAYPQMQQVPGYIMPNAYAPYNAGYYK